MYKPNFCSECGSRIERSRWHPWTSRKFCADCAPRFRRAQVLLPVIAGAALFGTGLITGRAVRSAPPPLTVERGELPLVTAPATKTEGKAAKAGGGEESRPKPDSGPDAAAAKRSAGTEDVVAICGALTKKGTPCQRRVHGTDRCWQHKGMPAIIPLEKRIVTGI